MEDQSNSRARGDGCFTVLICTLLTFGGIVGIAVGVSELGFSPSAWAANYRQGIPILVSGVLNLLAGTAMGFFHYRRAFRLLALALACRIFWSALAPWGWLDAGGGTFEFIGLLLAWWLVRNNGPGPNNSSKPTPLRGAA